MTHSRSKAARKRVLEAFRWLGKPTAARGSEATTTDRGKGREREPPQEHRGLSTRAKETAHGLLNQTKPIARPRPGLQRTHFRPLRTRGLRGLRGLRSGSCGRSSRGARPRARRGFPRAARARSSCQQTSGSPQSPAARPTTQRRLHRGGSARGAGTQRAVAESAASDRRSPLASPKSSATLQTELFGTVRLCDF